MLEKPKFFSTGKEFSVIESMFHSDKFTQGILGDDAFLFTSNGVNWVISSDISRENIHYDLKWTNLGTALEKAVISNLSDINAMGGEPTYLLLNISAAKKWDGKTYNLLKKYLRLIEKKYGVQIVGGDTILSNKDTFFSITALGKISGKPLLRSNAKPGHDVYVSGPLGRSNAGLDLLSSKVNKNFFLNLSKIKSAKAAIFNKQCESHHLCPSLHFNLGQALSKCQKKTSAIDISDGLSSELNHIAKQSRCKIILDFEKLPIPSQFLEFYKKNYWKKWVLHGGEEYLLVFTGDFSQKELYHLNKISKIYPIGKVVKGNGVYLKMAEKSKILQPKGWVY